MSADDKRPSLSGSDVSKKATKLGVVSGVYIPVYLNILSILMFLRFGLILGQVGLLGILGLAPPFFVVFACGASRLTRSSQVCSSQRTSSTS